MSRYSHITCLPLHFVSKSLSQPTKHSYFACRGQIESVLGLPLNFLLIYLFLSLYFRFSYFNSPGKLYLRVKVGGRNRRLIFTVFDLECVIIMTYNVFIILASVMVLAVGSG